MLVDPAPGRIVVENLEAWYAAQADVPGIEVHRDPDVTWMLSNGTTWANSGMSMRFSAKTAGMRLDEIFKRYAQHGRGIGFWVDDQATPADLTDHLKRLGLRCKKRFPGMWCDLTKLPKVTVPEGIRIIRTPHHSMYLRHPHPNLGPITTEIRRHELNRLAHLAAQWPDHFFDFVALAPGNRPVGACSMFLSESAAGLYDVGVLESQRGRGIGTAMLAYALRFARDRDREQAVLLASGMGYGMYCRAGFREVCKVAYWYRSLRG
ncbi:MAG TPA: GNAT family N-acetyltransferase [Bryobacteraceae bacterium]|nr:GNAT family N-acetyltransferase [Bryobacteraceae bacterium]